MKRVAFLPAVPALLLALWSAGAVADGVCAAPVDYAPLADDSGIGGSGRAAPTDSGIGGTGIVGTITGFASICVNGLEVHYDAAVPVSDNGQPSTARGLAVGQVVAIAAGNSPRGLEAKRIAVVHALIGPVTRSLDQHGQLEVMGAKVAIDQPQLRDQARELKAGDWVKISGHPLADHAVLASRVARIDAGAEVSVSGRADPERRRVGAVAVDRTGAAADLTVRGSWDGQRLQVRDSRPAEGTVWAERPARLIIETRVRQRDGQTIRTGRADVDAALAERRGGDDDLGAGTLLRLTARLDRDGKFRPQRIERARREDQRPARGGSVAGQDDEPESRQAAETSTRDAGQAQREPRSTDRDRAERIERSEKPDRVERPERMDRPERPDRPRRDR